MLIDEELLFRYGGKHAQYEPDDKIFVEGGISKYYFQIHSGSVELNNYDEDGKEFIQNILLPGHSIGESFLIGDMPYTVNAVAKSTCEVIKISKNDFLKMLNENPDVSLNLFKQIANRLSDKYYMLFTLISQDPESKIESVFDQLKKNGRDREPFSYEVLLTRQQIANLTGLRVETVIRTIKRMESKNKVKIRNRRIFC